ncbi:MlaA family lipoprotein [Kordiimonas laminariae]|uniref:MlaA family lipoprotein n=1 Tax=Kordiimonas laminariae TaxID=2917717 RepID=UPI001FF39F6D|nr:VacJ family lipoprotein [Kordiimonas laminariae]MCK0070661.1 VacJ family lipoprotein [Kordiimonas laminariae]
MPTIFSPKKLAAAALIALTSACASTQGTTDPNDPWEGYNRAAYGFNKAVDQNIYRPVASVYQTVIPEPPRQGISNIMRNLREPWVLVNDILQFKFKRAGTTLSRLVVNTTIGLGGIFKISESMGIPYHSEDLGQTLAAWGVGDGPYFIIPFVGPSNGRDAIGFGTYVFADPVTIGIAKLNVKGLNLTRTGVDALDQRARAHNVINSIYEDENGYELMRSAYRQNRLFEIHDGNPPSEDDDLFDELEDDETSDENGE